MLQRFFTKNRFVCATPNYNFLYSRYLQNPGKLLELSKYHINHHLLDLCGGTGAVSLEALKLGASPLKITLVDLHPRCHDQRIAQLAGKALDILKELYNKGMTFNTIVCRQAFAYLEIESNAGDQLAHLLALLIAPGGCFTFNSFIRPRWSAKTYFFDGKRYIELAGYFRRFVFHLQIALGIGYDLTFSKWQREERIFEIFDRYFDVETRWSHHAIYWICTRRNKNSKEHTMSST